MAETIRITAADSHSLEGYLAEPSGRPRGGVVVVQEIFGVNAHIRAVADRFAAAGYRALAPALFDRIEPGVDLGYDEAGVARGRALRAELGWDKPLLDLEAAMKALETAGKVAVVGFCWGGSLAWLAATRLDPAGAVCYYGAQIAAFAEERPRCPVLMHFGERDPLIPPSDVEKIRAARPEPVIFTYPAGHGFNCDLRADFHAASAALAWERTLAHLAAHVG